MLRICCLTSHKNNLIIDDFITAQSSDEFFLHDCCGLATLHAHKNNLIIDDFDGFETKKF